MQAWSWCSHRGTDKAISTNRSKRLVCNKVGKKEQDTTVGIKITNTYFPFIRCTIEAIDNVQLILI